MGCNTRRSAAISAAGLQDFSGGPYRTRTCDPLRVMYRKRVHKGPSRSTESAISGSESPVDRHGQLWIGSIGSTIGSMGHRDDEEQSCKDEDREFRPVGEMGWRPGMSREAYERLLRLIFGPID